jgi:hypothetical protein
MVGDIIILAIIILFLVIYASRIKKRILRDKGFPMVRRKKRGHRR